MAIFHSGSLMPITRSLPTPFSESVSVDCARPMFGPAISARKARSSAPRASDCETGRSERHRSEEHTSELQSLMRISYAVFCLKKKQELTKNHIKHTNQN